MYIVILNYFGAEIKGLKSGVVNKFVKFSQYLEWWRFTNDRYCGSIYVNVVLKTTYEV